MFYSNQSEEKSLLIQDTKLMRDSKPEPQKLKNISSL